MCLSRILKKALRMTIALSIVFTLLAGCTLTNGASGKDPKKALYVSPSGDDTNSGSKRSPFKTLERARDAVRSLKDSRGLPEDGVIIYLRGGKYNVTGSFALTAEDSGESGKPVVYAAYEAEEVYFMGGVDLDPAGFGPVTDSDILNRLPAGSAGNVLVYDLAAHGITQYGVIPKNGFGWPRSCVAPELFVDDKTMNLARYPNDGYIDVGNVIETGFIPRDYFSDMPNGDPNSKGYIPSEQWMDKPGPVFQYNDERADKWASEPEGWIFGYWVYDWADDNIKIGSIDTETNTINTINPSLYGCKSGQRFYGYNLLCELDAPGEWYLDRMNGKLYIYPKESITTDTVIQLSTLKDTMVTMDNVSNVVVKGITFENTCGKGITMMDCVSCTIAGCTIRRTGMRGIDIGSGADEDALSADYYNLNGGHDNTIISCDIYETGMGGIFVAGGDRQKLTPGNNKVENCNLWDYSRIVRTLTPAINMGGCGNIARHNLIHNAPHEAIQFFGNDMLIEYNEIYNVIYETDDAGAIYSGRDWTYRGNVIRYNYIHDIPGRGAKSHVIYADDCMSGMEVYGNIFYRNSMISSVFMIGGGSDHKIYNNMFIDCGSAIAFYFRTVSENVETLKTRLQNMPFTAEPWASRYPELVANKDNIDVLNLPLGNFIEKNAFIDTRDASIPLIVENSGTILDNKHYSGSDVVGLVNKEERNLNLKPESCIFKDIPGFQAIPFDKMGLYKDDYRKSSSYGLGDFDLVSPADGAEGFDFFNSKLTWSESAGAERYRLLISRDADFTDIIVDTNVNINQANTVSMNLPSDTVLYWKVEAGLKSDLWHVSKWSSVRSFKTS
ncbi:MAG: right-handed parallel beta-helix repeat-containing protein [Clostridiaceae bacterium]